MPDFEFQFQYSPTDHQAIHHKLGHRQVTPGTTITVWAAGLAVCLLVLGAIGSWVSVAIVLLLAFAGGFNYVFWLNRRTVNQRDSSFRTVEFSAEGVVEKFGDSISEKSWSAFDDVSESDDHFFLKHFEKVIAIPKRVIKREQIQLVSEYLKSNWKPEVKLPLKNFSRWFVDHGSTSGQSRIYRFRWHQGNLRHLNSVKLIQFDFLTTSESEARRSSGGSCLVMVFVFVGISFLMAGFESLVRLGWTRLILFPVAVATPLLVAFAWWKYSESIIRNRKLKIPEDELFVYADNQGLKLGYTEAIAHYAWSDILGFYYSEEFIGFRPSTGMVHVISNEAFGGYAGAIEFLRMADNFHRGHVGSSEIEENGVASEESGNPFQSPNF
ncbi:MAG: YcxB family protein [Planctomycetota bacterium]